MTGIEIRAIFAEFLARQEINPLASEEEVDAYHAALGVIDDALAGRLASQRS